MKNRTPLDGFNWHRRHHDEGAFVRFASAALTAGIIAVATTCSMVDRAPPVSGWCDVKTTNCYDRLAVPLRGSVR